MKKTSRFFRSSQGQAMVEYAIVACFVVIAAFAPYVNWTGSREGSTGALVTNYTARIKEATAFISLPCP
jgi:Flp pilus assembly pilin Flp